MKVISCEFNIDTACVELRLEDGTLIAIDRTTARGRNPASVFLLDKTNLISYNMYRISLYGGINMARMGLDKATVIERAAGLANDVGLSGLSLKLLAEDLNVKSPSLYNHIGSLEELKRCMMLYGWKQMSDKILRSVAGVAGYDAVRNICYAFYDYATANPGVFDAMLWYNKFEDAETENVTKDLFAILFQVTSSLNISEGTCHHLIRTLRGFLQGFALLVNNHAFGNPISIKESFDISVEVMIEGMKSYEGRD